MAESLRHLVSGTTSLGQFSEQMPTAKSHDNAVNFAASFSCALCQNLCHEEWGRRFRLGLTDYPDDDQCLDCRFKGEHTLNSRDLANVEHLILFLQSDLEWPNGLMENLGLPSLIVLSSLVTFVICVLSGVDPSVSLLSLFLVPALAVTLWVRHNRRQASVWPFRNHSDYAAALVTPALLAGERK